MALLQRETRAKIQRHLEKVWKKPRTCPICGSSNWHIQPGAIIYPAEELAPPVIYFEPNIDISVPTFQVICKVCSFFHSFLLMPAIRGNADGE